MTARADAAQVSGPVTIDATVVPLPTDASLRAAELDRRWRAFCAARIEGLRTGTPEAAVRAAEAFGALLVALRDAGDHGRNVFLGQVRRQPDRQA